MKRPVEDSCNEVCMNVLPNGFRSVVGNLCQSSPSLTILLRFGLLIPLGCFFSLANYCFAPFVRLNIALKNKIQNVMTNGWNTEKKKKHFKCSLCASVFHPKCDARFVIERSGV